MKDKGYFTFLRKQLSQFEIVFLVSGNHEPYGSSWDVVKSKLIKFEEEIRTRKETGAGKVGKFILLDQTRYDLSLSMTILGCKLFSNVAPDQAQDVSFGLNDFFQIDEWTVEQHTSSHLSDLAWLNSQVSSISKSDPDRKIIILSHYSPTTDERSVDPKHVGSKISPGFMTDLGGEECWKSKSVIYWGFGHTHNNCDLVDGDTGKRVVTNQRGYYFAQSVGFEHDKCVEV